MMNPTLTNQPPSSQFYELPRARCEELLAEHRTGRVAWNSPDGPQVLPVTYAMHAGDIILRTSPYGVLAQLIDTTNVAFEIDDIDEASYTGWSVMVRGRAKAVVASGVLATLWTSSGVVPWAPGTRNVFIAITPRLISGRVVGKP